MFIYRVYALLIAILIDLVGFSIPNKFHPVAWMGSTIAWMKQWAPVKGNIPRLFYGGLISIGGMGAFAAAGYGLIYLLQLLNPIISIIVEGLLVSFFFSVTGLAQASHQIYQALKSNDFVEARRLLSWHLVSRDTSSLDESQVAGAVIESVAENTSDSFIAPVFYFLVSGLPGMLAYRFANTADAILGYHTPELEWLGKIPARIDDLLNLIPARLTAILFAIASLLSQNDTTNGISVWWKDRYKTSSPNAGHPMSLIAGAFGIVLSKTGDYSLGEGGKQPGTNDILIVIRLMYLTLTQVTVLLVLSVIIHYLVK